MAAETLTTPVLLVAMPQVLDPFFHHSVILLVHHDEEEGSVGFIVNRRTGIPLAEILTGLEMSWAGEKAMVAYFGGPVQPQLGSVLFADDGEAGLGEGGSRIVDGVAVTQHLDDLSRLAAAPPGSFKLLLGYAGWGEGQLIEEILRNDWLTAPVQPDLVFAPEPGEVWEQTLRSVGVDPAHLPSWSAGGDGGESAN